MGKCLFMRKGETHTAPSTGILASEIAVGSTVKLMENGSPVEYLVVNQGIPSSSSLYDSSCNGVWLLRKDIHSTPRWGGGYNIYSTSEHDTFLNGTFLSLFDQTTRDAIVQAKIPYVNGKGNEGSVASGANGLSRKIFSLSVWEFGLTTAITSDYKKDGAKLDYFMEYNGTEQNALRAAYYNGTLINQWTRSPCVLNATQAGVVSPAGALGDEVTINVTSVGLRPALILPFNALFDGNTLVLKGVA